MTDRLPVPRPFTCDECEVIADLLWEADHLDKLINLGCNIGVTIVKSEEHVAQFVIYDFNDQPPTTHEIKDVISSTEIMNWLRISLNC